MQNIPTWSWAAWNLGNPISLPPPHSDELGPPLQIVTYPKRELQLDHADPNISFTHLGDRSQLPQERQTELNHIARDTHRFYDNTKAEHIHDKTVHPASTCLRLFNL
jgi:hypothetical protein